MFHHPDWAVGSYSCGPPARGNTPNLSQQNIVPDHQGHAVFHCRMWTGDNTGFSKSLITRLCELGHASRGCSKINVSIFPEEGAPFRKNNTSKQTCILFSPYRPYGFMFSFRKSVLFQKKIDLYTLFLENRFFWNSLPEARYRNLGIELLPNSA